MRRYHDVQILKNRNFSSPFSLQLNAQRTTTSHYLSCLHAMYRNSGTATHILHISVQFFRLPKLPKLQPKPIRKNIPKFDRRTRAKNRVWLSPQVWSPLSYPVLSHPHPTTHIPSAIHHAGGRLATEASKPKPPPPRKQPPSHSSCQLKSNTICIICCILHT